MIAKDIKLGDSMYSFSGTATMEYEYDTVRKMELSMGDRLMINGMYIHPESNQLQDVAKNKVWYLDYHHFLEEYIPVLAERNKNRAASIARLQTSLDANEKVLANFEDELRKFKESLRYAPLD